MDLVHILTTVILAAGCWAVLCRIKSMHPRSTLPRVFWQHFALGLGLFAGILLPAAFGVLSVSAGVLLYLLLGMPRWRFGAPWDVLRLGRSDEPITLDPKQWGRVQGGKK